MAKSVGTLKAMLVLDSKGFLGGFDKASQATRNGMRQMGKDIGRGAAGTWLRWTAALRVARMAIRALVTDIMKFRETSPVVNAAVESFFDLGRSLRDNFLHPMLEAAAPAFTFVFESALEAVNELGSALQQMGIGFDDISKAALTAGGLIGNSFKVISAGIESTLALLEEFTIAIVNARSPWGSGASPLDARQRGIDAQGRWQDAISAIGKILSGDTSAVVPKNMSRAFVPKAKNSPDLDFPALEMGTNDAFKKILSIQRPDYIKDHHKKVEQHLEAIDKNTKPKRGGDAVLVGKLGGR